MALKGAIEVPQSRKSAVRHFTADGHEFIDLALPNRNRRVVNYSGRLEGGEIKIERAGSTTITPAQMHDALVAFLQIFKHMRDKERLFMLRILLDVALGKVFKSVTIGEGRFIYFPDERGDRSRDLYVCFSKHGKQVFIDLVTQLERANQLAK